MGLYLMNGSLLFYADLNRNIKHDSKYELNNHLYLDILCPKDMYTVLCLDLLRFHKHYKI